MAEIINAKCPNCGAILELPKKLDRAFCIHCGGKVIIARDEVHYHKAAIACPECEGKGYKPCHGEMEEVEPPFRRNRFFKEYYYKFPCDGTEKCVVKHTHTKEKDGTPFFSLGILLSPIFCRNGKCNGCNGKGMYWGSKCDLCKGTKICFVCEGTGKCTYCNGTGKMKCKECNGTGFKVYQGNDDVIRIPPKAKKIRKRGK